MLKDTEKKGLPTRTKGISSAVAERKKTQQEVFVRDRQQKSWWAQVHGRPW